MPTNEERLVATFRERVLYFGLHRLSDPAAAEELAQDVLLAVLEALRNNSVRDTSRLGSFVFGVAANLVKKKYREATKDRERFSEQTVVETLVHSVNPEGVLLDRERIQQLRLAFQRLEVQDQELLRQCFDDPVPLDQLAERLGISYSALRKRKSRALARLRQVFRKVSQTGGKRY
jgi:RNA polymerase sigma-70 factor (ECF subfamily)